MKRFDFSSLSFLVLEDNQEMQRLVVNMLRGFGVKTIHTALDGSEGFAKLAQHRIDLAIVDWLAEPINGYDFVKRLRTDESSPNPQLPVLMITGHSERWRVEAARDAGVNEVMVKPVAPDGLLKRLIHMVEKPRPFVRTDIYFGPDRRRKADFDYDGPNRREGLSAAEESQIDQMADEDGSLSAEAISKLFG